MSELIALVIFISVSAAMAPHLLSLQQHSLEEMRNSSTAGQLMEIASAANQYIQANYSTLEAAAGTQNISIAQLEAAGDLSTAFGLGIDPYDQTWSVQVSQPKAGYLQGIILSSGGNAMSQVDESGAAAQTQGVGGFIPYSYFGSTATAQGAYGGWQLPMANYTNPGSGHMVGLLNYQNGQQINNDYLYRVAISGQPQLNTMQTTLNMGSNSSTNAAGYQSVGNEAVVGNTTNGAINAAGTTGTVSTTSGDGTATNNIASSNGGVSAIYSGGNTSAIIEAIDKANLGAAAISASGTQVGFEASGPDGTVESLDTPSTQSLYSGVVGSDSGESIEYDKPGESASFVSSPNGQAAVDSFAQNTGSTFNVMSPNTTSSGGILELTTGGNGPQTQEFVARSNGESGTALKFDLPATATSGATCTPNGAIAGNSNGNGATMSCISGVWTQMGSEFVKSLGEVLLAPGVTYVNSQSTPLFLTSFCTPMKESSGAHQALELYTTDPNNGTQSEGYGIIQQGGQTANFAANTTSSIIVPAGYYFSYTIDDTSQAGAACRFGEIQ